MTRGYTDISLEVRFSAGHRILGHSGKCKHLHGHNYLAKVTLSCEKLDELGMVMDFARLKEFVKTWIDRHWDHNMVLNVKDPLVKLHAAPELMICHSTGVRAKDVFADKEPYWMMFGNPTAENMAKELYAIIADWLPTNCDLAGRNFLMKEVAIREDEGMWAAYH